nr:RNA-directed DNA polymerase, eukaryota [Tanacetum cinerariifolium]
MGKPSFNTDAKGWTWIFRNNKNPKSKIIDNPYNKDLERFATSFYVSNLPDSLDAKGLWKACLPYGRLVDTFIANKRSKGGKRFGFIRFLGIKDANEFVKTLSNIWIGNFHLYVAVAIFQRGKSFSSQHVHRPPVKDTNPKTEPNPKNDSNPNFPYHQPHETKPSFADITLNKQSPSTPTLYKDTAHCLVDERMIWLEISGLPICAWGLNSYKKIASLFGKFKFFEDEETSMSLGRVCISTKSIKQISVTIKIEVNGELFDVNVLEIGTWNTNITDTASDVSSQMEANHLDKDDTSVEDKENDDLDDIDGILKDLDNDAKNKENVFVSPKEVVLDQSIKQVE